MDQKATCRTTYKETNRYKEKITAAVSRKTDLENMHDRLDLPE